MQNQPVIGNMRARIAQCRRLAKDINDPTTTEALLGMAEAIEADIRGLEAEEDEKSTTRIPLPPQG
jgi:hypothetical protein